MSNGDAAGLSELILKYGDHIAGSILTATENSRKATAEIKDVIALIMKMAETNKKTEERLNAELATATQQIATLNRRIDALNAKVELLEKDEA